MSKLFTASIDVTKIDKDLLYKGKKGTYLNIDIWLNDEPDQFGNTLSIQQKVSKGKDKNYLGNGKEFVFPTDLQDKPDEVSNVQPDDLPF